MSESAASSALDLAAVRRRLAGRRGRAWWRSLEELAETPEFLAFLQQEFPRQAEGIAAAADRRTFMKLMAASLGLAGLSACTRQPDERILPYVRQPEQLVLGEPLYFATAMPLWGAGIGLLVESHEGRPTKIEGNPLHPASLGSTDVFAQAALLQLYDPDRSQVVTSAGDIRTWSAFRQAAGTVMAAQRTKQGAGLRFLTEPTASPTLAAQLDALLAALPQARWYQWEAAPHDGARAGSRLAFGEHVDTVYRFDRADVVLALDADFLGSGPAHVRYARDFASRRRVQNAAGTMCRLYAVESTPTITGAKADHRLGVRAGEVEDVARAIAAGLGVAGAKPGSGAAAHRRWIDAVVQDLRARRGRVIVVAGDAQPAAVHALAHAINAALGAAGSTVTQIEPVGARPGEMLPGLRELVADMQAGRVECLVVVGGNPVYTVPPDLGFTQALEKVPLRLHHGLYEDETAELCHWHVPAAHFLESWSDVRAWDGTLSVVQPLIAPLYGGRTVHEYVAAFGEGPDAPSYDIVRAAWKARRPGADFDAFWEKTLHDGLVAGTAHPSRPVSLRPDWDPGPTPGAGGEGLEVVFRPDPHVGDGAFSNNGWLQELPKPLTRLVWDNAALVAPATAERLAVGSGDVIELRHGARSVRAPVWIAPGHPAEAVTLHLGYGRRRAGRLGTGIGVDANALRSADAAHVLRGVTVKVTGARYDLATTQEHGAMEGREPVRQVTLAELTKNAHAVHEMGEHVPARDMTLYPDWKYDRYAWGMAIDLSACIGCNTCTIACQAENNIAVVGKAEVARGHEMHWIRVDRYYAGDLDSPDVVFQPVPCMHCETAPCEVVCPTNATVHSSEGLNDMVYNRCVGTRYCSNNCPYKVRRFNFFLYSDWNTQSLTLARNPNVTVRSRGVMEKCSYCVQRINRARVVAQKDRRRVRDGDIVPACAQACPAEAIVFGDINDPDSRVAKLKQDPRGYALLAELNTRPRTTYLAALHDPNPALAGDEEKPA